MTTLFDAKASTTEEPDAGKLHVQFVRRTEVSARVIERASSDPTGGAIQPKARTVGSGE